MIVGNFMLCIVAIFIFKYTFLTTTHLQGGFSRRPKFPRPVILMFLTRVYASGASHDTRKEALKMTLHTLRKMGAGGMRDHLGGGFHRYMHESTLHINIINKLPLNRSTADITLIVSISYPLYLF